MGLASFGATTLRIVHLSRRRIKPKPEYVWPFFVRSKPEICSLVGTVKIWDDTGWPKQVFHADSLCPNTLSCVLVCWYFRVLLEQVRLMPNKIIADQILPRIPGVRPAGRRGGRDSLMFSESINVLVMISFV